MNQDRKERLAALTHSASFKLSGVLLLFMVPIICLLISSIFDVRARMVEQVTDAYQATLEVYMTQLDTQLQSSRSYSINNAFYEPDCQIAAFGTNQAEAQYARIRLVDTLQRQLMAAPLLDGAFLYLPGENSVMLNANSSKISTTARREIMTFIQRLLDQHLLKSDSVGEFQLDEQNWALYETESQTVLLYIVWAPNGITAGAYADVEQVMSNFPPIGEGMPLSLVSNPIQTTMTRKNTAVYAVSRVSSLALRQSFSYESIIARLPIFRQYATLIAVLLLMVPLVMVLLIRHIILRPLHTLTAAMEEVGKGNLKHRIQPRRSSGEIELIDKTFNSMLDEVGSLKNSVYEQKLASQKIQLRNLQLQIRPHFLINTLNMVYNLMESGRQKLAATLIIHAVEYFRYMVRVDDDLVALGEELKHTKTYMEIQHIRYQEHFVYEVQVDPMVEDMLVPPMLLQCFAENAMKYAFRTKKELHLRLDVTSFERDYYPYAKITVRDNGPGFPPEELPTLNACQRIYRNGTPHIGIYNTLARLRFLFGEQVTWRLYNDRGAVCEIVLPATFHDEG